MGVRVRERPKGSGIYWIFIDHQGKRKSKRIGTNEKLARDVAKKIEAKLILGQLDLQPKDASTVQKFSEYAEVWLEGYGKTALKYSTRESYRNELRNHITPYFGKKRLDEITRADVKQFIYDRLDKDLAPATVRKQVAYLSSILNQAVDDEIIERNPTRELFRLIPKKDKKADVNPLNKEEIHIFLEKAKELYPRYYPFFLCAARTGMRLGELLALEWDCVDFNGRFIEVRQSFSRHRLTTPKNKKIRRVDMSRQLTETLRMHRNDLRKESLRCGSPMSKWVFNQPNGKPLTATTAANRMFHRCLEKAGLRRVRFHDLRHSFASILIQQKESLAYVKEQMGHHSIQMTVDLYAHLAPEDNKGAVDRLDDLDFEVGGRNHPQPIRNRIKKAPKQQALISNGAGNGI